MVTLTGIRVNTKYMNSTRATSAKSTHKGVNQHSKDVIPMVTLTWHARKYKVHKLHQRYTLKVRYAKGRPFDETSRLEVGNNKQLQPEVPRFYSISDSINETVGPVFPYFHALFS